MSNSGRKSIRFQLYAWAFVILFGMVNVFLPPQWWFSVSSVVVHEAVQGECPVMTVNRVIKRPFYGIWSVEIDRVNENGEPVSINLNSNGDDDYRPGDGLPVPLKLDWWTGESSVCDLPPRRVHRDNEMDHSA